MIKLTTGNSSIFQIFCSIKKFHQIIVFPCSVEKPSIEKKNYKFVNTGIQLVTTNWDTVLSERLYKKSHVWTIYDK